MCLSPRFIYTMDQIKSLTPLKRKLYALDHHSVEELDIENFDDFKALINWLENQKIRFYKIEDRAPLQDETNEQWWVVFKKYLNDIKCPHDPSKSRSSSVHWLLDMAVKYEFSEKVENSPQLQRRVEKHTGLNTSSLNIESSDPVLDKGANALARILQVSQHHDPSVLLAACRLVIEEKLSEESLRDAQEKASSSARYHEITPQQCGFSFSDPVLGEAAKVLRLLHVKELRELQTKVNELIVAAQSITANPKTDSSLGRVGK